MVLAFAGVAVLLAAFVWWELRVDDPMLDPALFRPSLFSLGSAASFLNFLGGMSVFFLMPFYLQGVLDLTPGRAGLVMVPTAICFAAAGPIAGRLSDRFGWQKFAIAGLVFSALSLVMLSRLNDSTPVAFVAAAMALQGVGMGTFYSPNASAVLSTVERSRYGIATAFLNMLRNVANVIGIAGATTIVTVTMASAGYEPSLDAVSAVGAGQGVKDAFTDGLRTAFLVFAGLLGLAVLLSSIRTGAATQSAAAERQIPSKT